MRRVLVALTALGGLLGMAPGAEARVAIRVDLSNQTMAVSSADGDYVWPISSARMGYHTPRGTFGVQRMEQMHYSRKYYNSPMPHSLFFSGGYAIHGTYETSSLGEPASHGCIRISPANAAALYAMVKVEGGSITVTGSPPETGYRYASRLRRDGHVQQARGSHERDRGGDGFFYDPGEPLGYAPEASPGFYGWMNDPADY